MTNTNNTEDQALNLRNEVFRKAGRNLYLIQQIEKLLKYFSATNDISGPISKIQNVAQRKQDEANTTNMGPLVGNLIENIYTTPEKLKEDEQINHLPDEVIETHIRTSFKIQTTQEYIEQKKQALRILVDERNYLVHHVFSNIDLNSIDQLSVIDTFLDAQRERIIVEHEVLSRHAKSHAEALNIHSNFINSEQGEKLFDLLDLQQSSLINKLFEITLSSSRADGWTTLATAGNELNKALPGELDEIKKEYGHKTLKDILIASECFDLLEELTAKGGKRYLYRPKPDEDNMLTAE